MDGEDPFLTYLPDEILARILSFLTLDEVLRGPSKVSSRFRHLCGLHLNAIDLPQPPPHPLLTGEYTEHLVLCLAHDLLPRLRRLTLRVHRPDLISVAVAALEHCPMLERLEVDYRYQCYHELYQALQEHGKALKRLTLRNASVSFEEIKTILKGLTHLEFDRCKGPNDDDLVRIGKSCPNLQSFTCNNGSLSSLDFGREAATVFLRGISAAVKEIRVPGKAIERGFYEVLGSHCKGLQKLTVFGARRLEGDALRAIVDLPELRVLFVTHCDGLSSQDIVDAFDGERTKCLSCLELGCANLDDRGLRALAKKCGDSLTFLSLTHCGKDVTNVGIRCVVERCGGLERLHLQKVRNLTNDVLGDVRIRLPRLREIRIWKCPGIDREGLAEHLSPSGITVLS